MCVMVLELGAVVDNFFFFSMLCSSNPRPSSAVTNLEVLFLKPWLRLLSLLCLTELLLSMAWMGLSKSVTLRDCTYYSIIINFVTPI